MPIISNEDLIKIEPYRSIFVLLTHYRDGLQAKHFMYALSRKRDDQKKKMEYIDKDLEEFFTRQDDYHVLTMKKQKQGLEDLYQKQKTKQATVERRITAGCIKKYNTNPNQHLNKCLRILMKRGWVDRTGKRGNYTYFRSRKYHHDRVILSLKKELDIWYEDMLITDFPFDLLMQKEGFETTPKLADKQVTWELCGFPSFLLEKMDREDTEKINNAITLLKKNLELILQIKRKHMPYELLTSEEYDDEELFFNFFNIGFYALITDWKT